MGLRYDPWPSAVEDEVQEADHGVCADAIGQSMMNRRGLNVEFQHAEAALGVCEALVTGDNLGGAQILCVGDQRELAIKELGLRDGVGKAAISPAVGGRRPLVVFPAS